jgi:histidinol-phosphate/aromatic aminotransferase/cobyric acid decarboxylase-like protein
VELKPFGSGRARLAILVNPNNPTGLYARRTDEKCDALLSDEVFLDFAFDEKKGRKELRG